MRMWKLVAALFALATWTGPVSADPPKPEKSRTEVLPVAEKWGNGLTEEQLLTIPDRDTDRFKAALGKLAFYADGPRDHADEFLKAVGYPVDEQGPAWKQLSPATKIALAAKQAYVKSERDGQLFGALLQKQLAMSYPSLKREPELAPFRNAKLDLTEKPQFTTNLTTKELSATKLPAEIAKAVIHLASYVSSAGAVTDADLARMTPLEPSKQLEILVAAKNSRELLETLLEKSHLEFASHYEAKEAELLTKQVFTKWMKSVSDCYPALKKEKELVAWLGPLDPPSDAKGEPGGGGKPDAPKGGGGPSYDPKSKSGIPRSKDPGAPGTRPGFGSR
ncbi:hypothetical protein R5W23_005490 [Gemmata sp. JC673]|uniref:Uncharacterized protein n=1 Tax=Gemmata algarum TaxID=2975278 RepID=A0ABU5ESS7_9BACT|nr:hypothetical protein [Gemmata algarum]MDY3558397.1 hypothetical protein [Gemmata algarum]